MEKKKIAIGIRTCCPAVARANRMKRPGASNAADASGTWKGTFDFEGSSMPLTFHFAIANGAVTGTVEGLPTTPAEIHEGKLDGDTVTFWLNTDYQGQTYKIIYRGKVTAGQIVFSFGTDDGSWGSEMTATKGA
jgi:hypothetical protein